MTGPRGLGGMLAAQPMHFIWLIDCSGSMGLDGKIESLNTAIAEAIEPLRDASESNPSVEILMRVIRFSKGARWHVQQPTPLTAFTWSNVKVERPDDPTDLGSALQLLAPELMSPPMPKHAHRPHIVLVSDGMPSDDWRGGLAALVGTPWGNNAMRLAIAIGRDAQLPVLQKFIGNPEMRPLQANTPEMLAAHIRWASSASIQAVSQPLASHLPPPPAAPAPAPSGSASSDVWG
jgi:uncharacterized protein YegL